jgi:hypothetical protein
MKANSLEIFQYTNIGLVFVSNILVFWTWFNIYTATVDTMFLGLYIIPLIFGTIYYLGLLLWAFQLKLNVARNVTNLRNKNIALLIMNIVPIILIYKLTT